MKIKEIILEGFKSYGNRTQLDRLDPEFTSITGLNGSGKSNILDAICFVLGLSSLGLARASKIQDLVYKGGQAGIKEASVTIFFDNRNKACSPSGFEDVDTISVTRKIVDGDKTKYYVNGTTSTATNVKRMFKSIGLNIDHPETFFVQQGKITKIVSFKPNDIMEMLMESAGVAFYQEIAENSKLIMKEKSEKLDTTHERMKVSFGPKLLLLEKERAKVAEYESLKVELDRVTELLNRATLYKAHKTLKTGKDMLLQLEINMKELEKVRDHYRRQIESFDAKTGSDNAEIRELKENITVIEKEIENLKKVTYKTKSEREEKVQEKRLKTEKVQKLRETQALKEREIAQAQASKESTEVVIARLKERLEDIQQEKNQLTAKMSGGSSGDVALPLQNQLEKQRNNLLKVQDDIERTQKQIKNVHESLADGEKIKKKIELEKEEAERDEARLLKEMDSFSNIVRKCNSRIEK